MAFHSLFVKCLSQLELLHDMKMQAQKPLMAARVLHPPGGWNIECSIETSLYGVSFQPFPLTETRVKLISVIAASRQQLQVRD